MESHDPQRFGPVFGQVLQEQRLMPLGPGKPNLAAAAHLRALEADAAFAPARIQDQDMAAACLAGVWLYHDFLDESHHISQEIHTMTGSYWHGIMHRREPDFGNSKYWFRRVGDHPVFASLVAAARELDGHGQVLASGAAWNPFSFVDRCEEALAGQSGLELLCRQIQQREWELLFAYCYQHAIGQI
jgi:hypothetical protein